MGWKALEVTPEEARAARLMFGKKAHFLEDEHLLDRRLRRLSRDAKRAAKQRMEQTNGKHAEWEAPLAARSVLG